MKFRTVAALAMVGVLTGCVAPSSLSHSVGAGGTPYSSFTSKKTADEIVGCLATALPSVFQGQPFIAQTIIPGKAYSMVPQNPLGSWGYAYSFRINTMPEGTSVAMYVGLMPMYESTTNSLRDAAMGCK